MEALLVSSHTVGLISVRKRGDIAQPTDNMIGANEYYRFIIKYVTSNWFGTDKVGTYNAL